MHIRVDDIVEIIAGADKGDRDNPTRRRVLSVDREAGKVVVEGVNLVYKHVRKSQRNPQGGRLSVEMPVDVSNVKVVCPACNTAARQGVRYTDEGAKERFCKECGATTAEVAPPKASYAKK